jgi:glycosyltransferase involved in cell wall biosynthesis
MAAPIKILHSYKVYRPDLDGGIPSVIATLSKPAGDSITNEILVARSKGRSRLQDIDGVPVEAVTTLGTIFSTPIAPTYPFAFLRRVKTCDIVIHHAPFPLADMSAARLPKDIALIVYWHADIVGYSLLQRLLTPVLLRTLRRADRIIVADSSTISGSRFLAPFAAKCSVVPYGIDVEYWSTCTPQEKIASDTLRQKYPRMILAIGRLVPYKGFAVLLRAMKGVDGHAVLIGEGSLRKRLEKLAEEIGVSNRVTFAGRLSDSEIKAHVHAARVLAFPSITKAEAFGIVQLEAMAAGIPVVNTALDSAVPHIARHGHEALTVRPNDPHTLAIALRRFLDEPSLAARLGEAGRIRARTEYSQEKYVSRMKDVYRDVVQQKQSRV